MSNLLDKIKSRIESSRKKAKKQTEKAKKTASTAQEKAKKKTSSSASSSNVKKEYTPEQIRTGISNYLTNYLQKRLEEEPDNTYLRAWDNWNKHENAVNTASGLDSARDTRYSLTGGKDLRTSGTLNSTSRAAQDAGKANQYYASGAPGYEHDWLLPGWTKKSEDAYGKANYENVMNWARSGDRIFLNRQRDYVEQLKKEGYAGKNIWGKEKYDNQEEIDAAQAALDEMERLRRGYGYEEAVGGYLNDALPKPQGQATTYAELLDAQRGYSFDDYYADLETIYNYEKAGMRGDFMPNANDYHEARARVNNYARGMDAAEKARASIADPGYDFLSEYAKIHEDRTGMIDKQIAEKSSVYGEDESAFTSADLMQYLTDRELQAKYQEESQSYDDQQAEKILANWGDVENEDHGPDAKYQQKPVYGAGEYDPVSGMTFEDLTPDWMAAINDLVYAGEQGPEAYAAKENEIYNDPNMHTAQQYVGIGLQYMTDKQREKFYALYNSGDEEGALEFIEDISGQLNKQRSEAMVAEAYATAADGPLNAVTSSIGSIGSQLMSNLSAPFAFAHDALGIGKPTEAYDPVYNAGLQAQAARSGVLSQIEPKWGQILYQGGMSFADTLASALTFGKAGSALSSAIGAGTATAQAIANNVTTIAMSAGSAISKYQELLAEGTDRADAMIDAGIDGAIEFATEKFSIDNLFGKNINPIKSALQQVFVEPSEETVGYALRMIYDKVKYGENSELAQLEREYTLQFGSQEEAEKAVRSQVASELLETVLTSAVSGGIGGTVVNTPQAISDYRTGSQLQGSDEALYNIASGITDLPPEVQNILRNMKPSQASEDARAELIEGKNAQAQENATQLKDAEIAEDLNSEEARAELAEGKNAQARENAFAEERDSKRTKAEKAAGKVKEARGKAKKITNAQRGMVYRAAMQKLDGQAQEAMRDRISYDVAAELKKLGVEKVNVRELAKSILRIQDGSFTEDDLGLVQGVEAARKVLKSWTAKVVTENKAFDRMGELAGLLGKGSKDTVSELGEPVKAEPETLEIEDEYDAVIAEVQEREGSTLVSEGEASILDGEEIEILGVETAEAPETGTPVKVRIRTAGGEEKTVEPEEIAYGTNDDGAYLLASLSTEYGKFGADMYNGIQHGQDAVEYAKAFHTAAQYGSDGRNLDVLKSSGAASVLSDTQMNAAYQIGKTMRAERNKAQQAARSVKGSTVQTGRVDTSAIQWGSLSPQQEKIAKKNEYMWRMLAPSLGLNVQLVQTQADANGDYTDKNGSWDANTRTATVDIFAGRLRKDDVYNIMAYTGGHELTHYIKQFADSELWDDYQDFVMGHLDDKLELEKEIADRMSADKNLSRDGAIEEIIAQASVKALSKITEQDLANLAESNPTLFGKIKEFLSKWIKKLKEKIREAFGSTVGESNNIAQAMDDVLDEMAEKWNRMLVNASKKANETKAQKKAPAPVQTKQVQQEAGKQFIPYAHIDEGAIPFEEYVSPDDVKYSVREVDGKPVVWIADNILANKPADQNYTDFLVDYLTEHVGEMHTIIESGQHVYLGKDLPKEYVWSKYSQRIRSKNQRLYKAKEQAASGIGEAINIASNRRWEKTKHPHNKDAKYGIYKYDSKIAFPVYNEAGDNTGVQAYDITLVIRNASNGQKYLYDIQNIKNDAFTANTLYFKSRGAANKAAQRENIISGDIIAQNEEDVKFSMREPVERAKNLIAVHNLNEYKLNKALKLGGFPMPSIAIAKTDIGHQNFGDISLVFGRETIDPKVNRKNKVYSADAWTPTFPRIEYEADPKVEKRIRTTLTKLGNSLENYLNDRLRQVVYGIDEYLNRFEGEEGFIEYAMQNYGLKAAFLEDQGRHVDMVQTEKRAGKEYSEAMAASYQKIIDLFDGDMEMASRMPLGQIRDEYGAELEQIRPGSTKSAMRLSAIIRNATEYQQTASQPARYEMVADYGATERSIDEQIDKQAFEAWVRDLFGGIEGNSGVYNNKPLFTDAGNRRSFASTHMPVTVENIAKAMATQGNTKNTAGFHGIKSVRAATARTFKNVDEMHAYEGRIQNRTEAEAEALNEELNSRLYALIHEIMQARYPNGNTGLDYTYAEDALGEIFLEMAEGNYSVSSIQKTLAGYGHKVSTETAEAVKQLFDDTAAMPVNMYEAKPERAVGFEEVRFAVVPDDIGNDVLNELSKVVPDVRTYAAGDEAARLAMLNSEESVRFQERDPNQISDRALLATALQSVTQNADEWDNLRRYQKKIAALNEKQRMLEQTNARIAELTAQDAKANRDEIIRLRNAAAIYAKQIDRADGELLKYEAMKPIKKLADREREAYRQRLKAQTDERIRKYKDRLKMDAEDKIREVREREAEKRRKLREQGDTRLRKAVQQQREAGQRKVDRMKESDMKAKYKARIQKDVGTMREWLTKPTNKGHVPQFLRAPLADFLESLDFSSDRSLKGGDSTQADAKMLEKMEALRRALANTRSQQADIENGEAAFRGYMDLPAGFADKFDEAVENIRQTLAKGGTDTPINRMTGAQLKDLSDMIRTINTAVRQMNSFLANSRFEKVSEAARNTMSVLAKLGEKISKSELLDKVGSFMDWTNTTPYYAFKRFGEGGKAIFQALMDGWDKLAFNSKELIDYANSVYTTKQVRDWSKELHTIDLNGKQVQMTTAQIMSLYCLNKREQARGHLLGGGIRIADIQLKGKVIRQADNHILSESDIDRITDLLTDEQIAVADKLQYFMNTRCTEWGNEVSMRRFGYEAFGDEANYFPIESDSNNLKGLDAQAQENSLFRLLNLSATKSTVKNANNALVVRDIFDVFSAHGADMAKYNALALPILDALKWYNYVDKTNYDDGSLDTQSIQKSLEKAYGKDAQKYIRNFLKDLNGVREGGRSDGLFNKMLSNYKLASVANNLRVGMLQITSMPRAAYAIDPKYLAIGAAKNVILQNSKEAKEKVGIGLWKSLGFYDTNISRNVREMVKHDQNLGGKIKEKSMILAEKGDAWTMGVLYGAVQAEMADKHPGVKKGTEAYDRMVNERMREIVYQTQVVDSTMTRSDIMRDTGAKSSLATAFMSEPTLTMNMLADSIFEQRMKARATGKKMIAPSRLMVKAFAVNAVTLTFSTVLEAAFTAWRDDDEYETLEEKYDEIFMDTLLENMNLLNNIPFVKDVVSAFQGNSADRMDSAWAYNLYQGVEEIYKYLTGKSTNPAYNGIYKTLNGLSQMSGFAVGGLTRELVSAYNNLIATRMGYKRIQTYNDSASDAAKAILNAYTAGEDGLVARYLDIAAKYGIEGEKLENAMNKAIKAAYTEGEMDADTAKQLTTAYGGKSENDAYWLVREWDHTGEDNFSKYTDLKNALAKNDRSAATAAYRELVEHGAKEETITSQLSELYNKGEATSLLNLQMRSDRLYTSTLKLKADGQVHKDDFDAFLDAIVSGGNVAGEISKLRKKGYTTSQCMSAINGAFGKSSDRFRIMEKYNSADARILLDRILDAYEALGLGREEELKWINENWTMPADEE